MVHFNQDYGSGLNSSVYYVNEYVDYDLTDSLAIMSVFFDVQKRHNQKLWPLINGNFILVCITLSYQTLFQP